MARNKKKEDHHSLKAKMAEMSEMPKDVVRGRPVRTMTGQTELHLENHRGIIEYTDLLVRIRMKNGQIRVKGKNLNVSYYTNDEMKVKGYIEAIEYQH